ncbi:uncharacterized protein LOC106069867 [Biomphalaria glabrata]|uniref:Uncharacterized protein LOC106069867 n=1 Tax=Biomphalaria glabrata TaxID=6526 RepID=A0A9W2Z6S5_BIOGL|nr:uncharacterized protein LOC106069867 [Biomphalaria glabrata]KAI8776133.1 hypothetical protein BgiBS90_023289 [Biomphalaria glabrata]
MNKIRCNRLFAYYRNRQLFLVLAVAALCIVAVEFVFSGGLDVQTSETRVLLVHLKSIFREEQWTEPTFCKFMEINPYSSNIMKISGVDKKAVECSGYFPDLTYVNGSRLLVDQMKILHVQNFTSCKYRNLFRHTDNIVKSGNWSQAFTNFVELQEVEEFILVECRNSTSGIVSRTYHARVPRHNDVVELNRVRLRKRQVESDPTETLSIIMIGMDGTSRHQMMRGMNKTYSYLMGELNSFDLSMHNQVGSNTFPNLVPLLSGHTAEEVESWWERLQPLDPLDTLWRDFTNAGFQTLFSEDYPTIGALHYLKKGFLYQPTTYNSRPICLALEHDHNIWSQGSFCIGNTPETMFHFDYLNTFLETVQGNPYLAILFLKKLTHDDTTRNNMADLHTYNFYKLLQDSGKLNNTLLISFSDHGPRWGAIRESANGIVEGRAPYAIFTFPNWFIQKYPDVVENFQKNTKRLTTHFDTHATLRDLLYFKARKKSPLAPSVRGQSLFQEIPRNRTCSDASIPMEFCLCGQETMIDLHVSSNISRGLADIVVSAVNRKPNSSVCSLLRLKAVLQIRTANVSSLNTRDVRLFKVKVQTVPGDAIYEGTVQTKFCTDAELLYNLAQLWKGNLSNPLHVKVGDSIDRLNLYSGQADCELNPFNKPYCYCQNLLPA